eukprot:13712110-Heterocapsa_arctica.AAC.1
MEWRARLKALSLFVKICSHTRMGLVTERGGQLPPQPTVVRMTVALGLGAARGEGADVTASCAAGCGWSDGPGSNMIRI